MIECREPTDAEMAFVYMMGFDAWSGGKDARGYLAECLDSPKYAKGTWRVLSEDHWLLSSLVVFDLSPRAAGIGSIATSPDLRGRGHASRLVSMVVADLERTKDRIFLFSDIPPEFYERLGFAVLPEQFQKKPGTACMLRARDFAALVKDPAFAPPEYF
jgi:ribosomal protein S18 acetylase RimI-like enzyme